ncbi:TIGR02302 family protein [Pikeienuella sp. HZG-20]|uniref:TIGR02302 family protein n=1 Tax=Paludibacillus litoralis TaxID=3133267 RepID=UPI0030ED8485
MEETPSDRVSAAFAEAEGSVRLQARRARRALALERLIAAFWPLWALGALFLGLALLGIPALLPPASHAALLAAFAAGAAVLAARGARAFRAPTIPEAIRRLDEGVPGRPAQTYADTRVGGAGDAGTEALWAAHQRRTAARAAALRAPAPDLRASARDPFALRHGGLIVLAAGALAYFGADESGARRLVDQFTPGALGAGAAAAPAPTLEAWATPPAYTGANPVYLSRLTDGAPIALPVGSEVSLRVFDVASAPRLEETVSADGAAFADKGAGVHDTVFTLARDGAVRVVEGGREMGAWTLTALPDAPPVIAFEGAPKAGERGALTLSFTASDDYGVRAADVGIALDEPAARALFGAGEDAAAHAPIALDLPLPLAGDVRDVAETLIADLTAHPWAGLPVVYTLTAHDSAGRTGVAEMRGILPARRFVDPMAKALIEQRRALAFSRAAAPRVFDVLEAVTNFPEDVFDDAVAYLAARVAIRRLGHALEDGALDAETPSIVDLLWKAAIRIEDGDLSSAAERLARAEERLRDAVENGATDEEMARLMQELREAMRDYLDEMSRQALRDEATGENQAEGDRETMTMDDLERMLKELEDAIANGEQELARQMLQALREMMENLQMATPGEGSPGAGEPAVNELGDMIGEQQGLADRSFGQMRQGEGRGRDPGQGEGEGPGEGRRGEGEGRGGDRPGGDSAERIARDQQALRQLLDELRGGLPGEAGEDARRALDEADRAMGDAVRSLEDGDERRAVDDQVRALDALREGRRALGEDIARAQGRREGDQAGREGRGGDAGRDDPLGRPSGVDGPLDGGSASVPGAALGSRARELQEEIRRRAGERARPPEELDYLDRLLDRF